MRRTGRRHRDENQGHQHGDQTRPDRHRSRSEQARYQEHREVLIVEHVVGLGRALLHDEGPGAQAPGPRVMGRKHHLPTGSSGCRIHTGRHSRRAVRGSHKRDRRPPHVRWKLRCPPQNSKAVLTAGDPTVFGPPFPLLPLPVAPVVPPAGVRAPRNFMAPHTYGGSSCIRPGPETASALPAVAPTGNFAEVLTATTIYGTACGDMFHRGPASGRPRTRIGPPALALTWTYVRVLTCTFLPYCAVTPFHHGCRASHERFRALFDARSVRLRLNRSPLSTRENVPGTGEDV
jgi:hypothetical protein